MIFSPFDVYTFFGLSTAFIYSLHHRNAKLKFSLLFIAFYGIVVVLWPIFLLWLLVNKKRG